MKIAILIATRKGSVRIKNKSTKKFGRTNLTKIKLDQAKQLKKIVKNLYFSSDFNYLNNYARSSGFINIFRPKKYLGKSTISQFGPFLAHQIIEDHICYITNTSPLIKLKTIKKCINIYKKLDFKKYDSLSTFSKVNEFLWDDKKPINYDLKKQPRSQDLDGLYKFIPAVTIIPKKNLIKNQNVIGKKPFKVIIDFPENIDIDENYQYKIANLFYNKKKNK